MASSVKTLMICPTSRDLSRETSRSSTPLTASSAVASSLTEVSVSLRVLGRREGQRRDEVLRGIDRHNETPLPSKLYFERVTATSNQRRSVKKLQAAAIAPAAHLRKRETSRL